MAEAPGPLPDLGLAAEAERGRSARATEVVAGLLSVVWVIAVLSYILTSPPGNDVQTLGLVMTLLIVFLPLALIQPGDPLVRAVATDAAPESFPAPLPVPVLDLNDTAAIASFILAEVGLAV